MKRLLLLLIVLLCSGCATGKGTAPAATAQRAPRINPSEQLAVAVKWLAKGEVAPARKALVAAVEAPQAPGVTDEALFRLALLSLKGGGDNGQAYQLLRRLKKEFPTSPWTAQAQPLADQLVAIDDLKRQSRNYRSHKDALSRENSELRDTIDQLNKNIDQLKHLDIELEKKGR